MIAGAGRALAAAVLGLGVLPAVLSAACARPRAVVTGADLAHVQRWWIILGTGRFFDSADWQHQARDTQMVVLSGDAGIPLDRLPATTIKLAYVSVGEVGPHAGYWPTVRGQPYLVEPNPDWPGNMRVDVRDGRWRELLLREEVPRLLALGFDGVMLDTLDTAPYLERKDASRFAGSRQALRDWLQQLRASAPRAIVVANGSESLVDAAPYVDGFVVEGLFATYDFGRRVYRPTTAEEQLWKLTAIATAQAQTQAKAQTRAPGPRPVFSIEYAEVGDMVLGRWAADQSARQGFRPYVGVKDLNTLP